jgi:hypothetical protein
MINLFNLRLFIQSLNEDKKKITKSIKIEHKEMDGFEQVHTHTHIELPEKQ